MKNFIRNKLRAAVSLLTVFAILLSMTFTGRVVARAASTDILGGTAGSDPLQITVNADGSLALYFWQGSGYVRQYYNETAWGTNVFFTSGGNSLHYSSPYYGAAPLGAGSQSRSGNTIRTTWSLSGGMNLEQDVTYIPGQSYYEKKWILTNVSGSGMTDLKLFHGGDTYFGGEDAAYSYYNPQTKMVYVKNRDMTRFGLMGFSGSPTSPADRYFSGQYGTGRTEALNGSLDNTANNSFQDAGYQLEWDHATLAPGANWTIDSFERITPPSVVQVLSPAEQTTSPGGTVTYEFVLQNFESATNTYNLTATSQNGWETSIKEGLPVTVDGNGATKVVHISVKTPSNASNGASDSVTLKAVKSTDSSVLSSASTTTHIDATLPSITSVTPSSNTFTPGSTLNVTVGTANVAPGTAVSVQLLDGSKNPLSPPVTGSGTTDASGQSVVALNIPGNLPAGATYALSVSVTGVAAVQDATTVQTSTYSRPSILCFYAGTSNPYVSGTPTNRDITFSSTESSLQYSVNNGTTWQTFTSPLSVNSHANYLFRQSGDGNQDDYVSINANIAKSFTATVGGVSNNGQYSSAVTPTFTGATAVLSKDGGDAATISSGTPITQSGIYALTLTDAYGNTQTESFMIDTTAAAISVTGNPSSWVNTDVKLNLLATAGISGVAGVTVSKDGSTAANITGQEAYTVTDNGSYVFTVTNGLGATASQTVNVTKIDKTVPTLSVSGNPSGWVNTDVKLDLSAVVGVSGIMGLTVSKDGGIAADITGQNHYTVTDNGSYVFTLTNGVGTAVSQTVNVTKIDKTAPTISVSGNPSGWVNADVKLNLLATAGISGVAGVTVSKDGGAATDITGQTNYTVTDNGSYVFTLTNGVGTAVSQTVNVTKIDKTAPTISVSGNPSGWVNTDVKLDLSAVVGISGIASLTVSKDGGAATDITGQTNYTVTDNGSYVFTLTNGVGTAVSQTVNVTKIDKTAPTISVSGNPSRWVNTDVKLDLLATAGRSGIASLTVSKDGGAAVDITGQDTYTEVDNGSYVFTLTNGVGTAVSQTVNVTKIDKTAPTISVSGNPSGWVNTDVKLGLSASAGISGIASLTVSKDGGTATDITGQKDYTVTDNGRYVFTVTNGYGTSVSQTADVIKIDKAVPTLFVSGNPAGWVSTDVKLDLLAAAGRSGIAALTVSKNGGAATDITGQTSYTVTDNGSYVFTVTNGYGTSVSQTVDVTKIDKTAPSLSITGNPSGWGKTDISLGISSAAGLSGITSLTVVKDGGAPTDLMGQTNYTVSQNGSYVFTLVNGAGVTETQTVTVGKIDKSAPSDLAIHFKNNVFKSFLNFVTFNLFYQDNVDVTLTAEDSQSGIDHFEYQLVPSSEDYNPNGTWTSGSQFTISPQFKGSIYARVYDKLGNVSTAVSSDGFTTTTISPTVTGAANGGSYHIGRVVSYSDAIGEIGSAVYSRDGGASVPFDSGTLFSVPGSYTITVTDKSGNASTFSFAVHALPAVSDVLYTQTYKNALNEIAAEYQSHTDLPQAYGADTGKAISNLLAQYAKLDAQVADHQNAIKNITAKINELPSDKSGMIALLDTIQNEIDAVSGSSSALTAEQKLVLKSGADYLNRQLSVIRSLQAQVEEVKSQISALPQATAVTKNDTAKITNASHSFDQLNKEQKGLVGTELTDKLNAVIVKLRTLMLYDKQTDCTVTGIDGTSFDPSVYLSVKQVSETTSGPKFGFAASAVNNASASKPELQGKEVVALYNISMFQGNTVIEPNGKVQVKIKIPQELKNRVNLDMVRINDDGSVVPLNATVQGDYLVFVTDHFSTYAMVAKNTCIFGICRFFGIYEADGGICYDWAFIAGAAALLAAASIVVLKKRRRKKDENTSVPS